MRKIVFSLLTMPIIFFASLLLMQDKRPLVVAGIVGAACTASYLFGLLQGFANSDGEKR